jgi:transposase
MPKKYVVRLTSEERELLQDLVSKGKTQAYRIRHAHILLKADADGPAWLDRQITEAFSCNRSTVEGIRKRFVMEGLDSALERKKRAKPPTERILDGAKEARLIALACSEPPAGRSRWTLHLLADELVALNIVEKISYRTVQRTLKKTNLSLT